jgi:hypothetical protein
MRAGFGGLVLSKLRNELILADSQPVTFPGDPVELGGTWGPLH